MTDPDDDISELSSEARHPRVCGSESSAATVAEPGQSTRSAFELIVQRSPCVYAAGTKLRVSPYAREDQDLGEILETSYSSFSAALEECVNGGLDGYVLQLPSWAGASVETLRCAVYQALNFYASRAGPQDEVSSESLRDPAFWFQCGEHRLFVIVFGPCYDDHHPRHSYGRRESFLLFQHRLAFKRRHPGDIPVDRRLLIRRRFAEHEQFYDNDMGAVP